MYCKYCGKLLREDAEFCTKCGEPTDVGVSPEDTVGYAGSPEETVRLSDAPDETARLSDPQDETVRLTEVPGNPRSAYDVDSTAQMPPMNEEEDPDQSPFFNNADKEIIPPKKHRGGLIAAIIIIIVLVIAALAFVFLDPMDLFGWHDDSERPATIEQGTLDADDTIQSQDDSDETGDAGSSAEDSDAADDSGAESNEDYVLPDSDERYYDKEDLEDLSDYDLYLARNEIFARHGRGFNNSDLQSYFDSKDWYTREYDPDEFDAMSDDIVNDYEKKNADLIRSVEQERGSEYAS